MDASLCSHALSSDLLIFSNLKNKNTHASIPMERQAEGLKARSTDSDFRFSYDACVHVNVCMCVCLHVGVDVA